MNASVPSRPRPRNRGGGSSSVGGTSQNAFNQHPLPMPPPFHVFEVPYGIVPPPMLDTSVRGPRGIGGSHSHASNDHSQRNNSRRGGGYGTRPRGDGQYHSSHGGRRDQGRRDVHHTPPYPPPPPIGYVPSHMPPGLPPFLTPPPVRVFPGQMGFGESIEFTVMLECAIIEFLRIILGFQIWHPLFSTIRQYLRSLLGLCRLCHLLVLRLSPLQVRSP